MRAVINKEGQLVLTPESETEEFALIEWYKANKFWVNPSKLRADNYSPADHGNSFLQFLPGQVK